MNIQIRKYEASKDYDQLLEIVTSEGEEWADYLTPTYENALRQSITYIALADGQVCGYSRSMNDNNIFIWVVDLLVHKDYRGHSIGRKLMECVCAEFPGLDVYVMSDVDAYYTKLGYKKEGSIYRVQ
jgi:GNAT superfamily N-acetyltransferase